MGAFAAIATPLVGAVTAAPVWIVGTVPEIVSEATGTERVTPV
jgi:hypothetical protein